MARSKHNGNSTARSNHDGSSTARSDHDGNSTSRSHRGDGTSRSSRSSRSSKGSEVSRSSPVSRSQSAGSRSGGTHSGPRVGGRKETYSDLLAPPSQSKLALAKMSEMYMEGGSLTNMSEMVQEALLGRPSPQPSPGYRSHRSKRGGSSKPPGGGGGGGGGGRVGTHPASGPTVGNETSRSSKGGGNDTSRSKRGGGGDDTSRSSRSKNRRRDGRRETYKQQGYKDLLEPPTRASLALVHQAMLEQAEQQANSMRRSPSHTSTESTVSDVEGHGAAASSVPTRAVVPTRPASSTVGIGEAASHPHGSLLHTRTAADKAAGALPPHGGRPSSCACASASEMASAGLRTEDVPRAIDQLFARNSSGVPKSSATRAALASGGSLAERTRRREEMVAATVMKRYQSLAEQRPDLPAAMRSRSLNMPPRSAPERSSLYAAKLGASGSGGGKRPLSKSNMKGLNGRVGGMMRSPPSPEVVKAVSEKHKAEKRELFEKLRQRNKLGAFTWGIGEEAISPERGSPVLRAASPPAAPPQPLAPPMASGGSAEPSTIEVPMPVVEDTGWRFQRVKPS